MMNWEEYHSEDATPARVVATAKDEPAIAQAVLEAIVSEPSETANSNADSALDRRHRNWRYHGTFARDRVSAANIISRTNGRFEPAQQEN